MSLIVQKYGGASVGTTEKIKAVAKKIIQTQRQGHRVAVVVSAMSGETDRLLSLAKDITDQPEERELDVLLSTGEQVTIALLSMALEEQNYKAQSFTGGQAHIRTDSFHNKARIIDIDTDCLHKALNEGRIVVIAGFQGMDEHGHITTLGRGGSDTTAVAITAVLGAEECHIYTDVDGVYTADPKIVPEARRLEFITYEEMLEMASLGAKILQIRSVEFARKYNVRLKVLPTFNSGPGTLIIDEGENMEQALVSGIAHNRDEAKLTITGVPDKPGIAYRILGRIANANIEIDMIVQNVGAHNKTDFTFTVNRNDYKKALELLKKIAEEIEADQVSGDDRIVKISVIGVGMRSHAGVASKMFKALADEGINIQMISTSEIKISVVVAEKYLELGVRTLHAAFDLSQGTSY